MRTVVRLFRMKMEEDEKGKGAEDMLIHIDQDLYCLLLLGPV